MLKFRYKVYISNPHKEFCALLPTFLALTIPGPTSNHYTASEYTSIVASWPRMTEMEVEAEMEMET